MEAVITDKKIAVPSDTNSSLIAYYKPDINAAEDYYPFGWAMPGRTWEADRLYRYGFNGKEYDNDVKGKWGQQDYGMRIYDPRVGRFLSVDPLTRQYPMLTPYQFASNRPIDGVDQDGLEWELSTVNNSLRQQAESVRLDNPRSYFSNPANWDIMMQDVHGTTVIGKRRDVEFNVANVQRQYNEAVGENIRNGLGGAIGYQLGGGKGSFVGASVDGMVLSFGGLPGKGYSTATIPRTSEPEVQNTEQVARAHSGNNEAATQELRVGPYKDMKKSNAGMGMSNDHIPSYASLVKAEELRLGRPLSAVEKKAIQDNALTLEVPTPIHISTSETYGGRNKATTQMQDALNPVQAVQRNVNAYRPYFRSQGFSNQQIDQAIQKLVVPFQAANLTNNNQTGSTNANNH